MSVQISHFTNQLPQQTSAFSIAYLPETQHDLPLFNSSNTELKTGYAQSCTGVVGTPFRPVVEAGFIIGWSRTITHFITSCKIPTNSENKPWTTISLHQPVPYNISDVMQHKCWFAVSNDDKHKRHQLTSLLYSFDCELTCKRRSTSSSGSSCKTTNEKIKLHKTSATA